ncbi:MAG: hypothetical protein MJE68_22320 [Proteobacteria bacterium]|nr:hypothetical protein [Pseudomonadota bacterium]
MHNVRAGYVLYRALVKVNSAASCMMFDAGFISQEKRRILEKFPDSHKLKDSDERYLQDTLKKAREKEGRRKSD